MWENRKLFFSSPGLDIGRMKAHFLKEVHARLSSQWSIIFKCCLIYVKYTRLMYLNKRNQLDNISSKRRFSLISFRNKKYFLTYSMPSVVFFFCRHACADQLSRLCAVVPRTYKHTLNYNLLIRAAGVFFYIFYLFTCEIMSSILH